MTLLTQLPIWNSLSEQAKSLNDFSVAREFSQDPERFNRYSVEAAGLLLDYSKQKINTSIFTSLLELAKQRNLKPAIEALFKGECVNTTEALPALHTALRSSSTKTLNVNQHDIVPEIQACLEKMRAVAEDISSGRYKGHSGKKISDVVNIGVGGSDLGPAMVYDALESYNHTGIKAHFISNLDSYHLDLVLKNLNPETTLFIIVSKSFSTQETQLNATLARQWLINSASIPLTESQISQHFFAVTARAQLARELGISAEHIFPIWDWVGGRFSVWSAVGLILIICLGMDNFKQFLRGAELIDQHFLEAEFSNNMPVILALLGIWNQNFLGAHSQAIIPYDQRLSLLPNYLQQLLMESLGKKVTTHQQIVDYTTGVVIWGGVGTNSQHAFHQLFMQGTQWVPIDFIISMSSTRAANQYHSHLVANCLSQARTLMQGKNKEESVAELLAKNYEAAKAEALASYLVISGSCSSNIILMEALTPAALGALLALYEHMCYVQAVIWDIDPFDQWGVEWGKKLAREILQNLATPTNSYDASTSGLLKKYQQFLNKELK